MILSLVVIVTVVALVVGAYKRGQAMPTWRKEIHRRQDEQDSRVQLAKSIRKLEHKQGIGPFMGREDYCDLAECSGEVHDHEDVCKVTNTGKAVARPEPSPSGRKGLVLNSRTYTEETIRQMRGRACRDGSHDHEEIWTTDRLVRVICRERPDFESQMRADEIALRMTSAMPSMILSGGSSIRYSNTQHDLDTFYGGL